MTAPSPCPPDETLAALLDGELTHNHALAVREHAQSCAACRAREAHLSRVASALSRLELPADESFVASVSSRLRPRSPGRARWLAMAPALAAAAALAAVVVMTSGRERPPLLIAPGGPAASAPGATSPSGLVARGSTAPAPPAGRYLGFEAFVHPGSRAQARRPLREGGALAPGDGLSFLLHNRSQREARFLLFAVDSERTVHWFYPAYLAPGTDPTSPVLAAEPQVVSLGEGVTPDRPAAGAFQVVAVFAPEELRVQQVEQILAEGSLEALHLRYPAAEIQVIHAQVTK